MQKFNLKCFVLLLGFLLPAAWYGAYGTSSMDGHSSIIIKDEYTVKNSVSITSTNGNVAVSNTDKITFRVTDSFEITGPFQVDLGGEFTVIRQDCPTQ